MPATNLITDPTAVGQWEANFAEQGAPNGDLLARIAVDLGLGAEVIDADGYAIGDLIGLLAAELLHLYHFDKGIGDLFGAPSFSSGGDLRAAAIKAGLDRVLRHFGQDLTLKRGGASMTLRGAVALLNTALKYEWFTSAETAAWLPPSYVVTLAGDAVTTFASPPLAPGDSITLYGHDYTVQKIDRPRIGGVVVRTTLFCARTS